MDHRSNQDPEEREHSKIGSLDSEDDRDSAINSPGRGVEENYGIAPNWFNAKECEHHGNSDPEEGGNCDSESRSASEDGSRSTSPDVKSRSLCENRARSDYYARYQPYFPNGDNREIHDDKLYVIVSVADHIFTGLIDTGNSTSFVNRYMAGICQLAGWERKYEENGSSYVMGEATVDGKIIHHRYWVRENMGHSVTLGMDILKRMELKVTMNDRVLKPHFPEPNEEPMEGEVNPEVEQEVFSEVEEEEQQPPDEIARAPVEQSVVEAESPDKIININGLPRGIRITIKFADRSSIRRRRQARAQQQRSSRNQ